MKKIFVFAAVAAFAALSCQKNEETPVQENQGPVGIPMTLTAGIDEVTKVDYVPSGNVLLTSWEAEESISVITLDGNNGNVVAIDKFTSTGTAGRENAKFTGTFTGGASPVKVIAIYPALSESGGEYATAPYKNNSGLDVSFLWKAIVGEPYIQSRNQALKQAADGDASHLKNYCIMSGEVNVEDIKNNKLSTTLSNQMTVLKVTITLPDAAVGKKLTSFELAAKKSDDTDAGFARGASWEYVDIVQSPISAPGGGFNSRKTLYLNNIEVPAAKKVTLYMVNSTFADQEAGNKLVFTATDSESTTYTATRTVTGGGLKFYRGCTHTVSATLNVE